MPVAQDPYAVRRLAATAEESGPRVARMLEDLLNELNKASGETTGGLTESTPLPESEDVLVQRSAETASFFAEAARRPFTHDLARGNLCVFVAGRADEADMCKVTVVSILRFNPGMRVAVAAEDAGLRAYTRWVQEDSIVLCLLILILIAV